MNRFTMDDYLFHGIKPYRWKYWEERSQEEANVLKSILTTGYIYSRNY